MSEVGQQTEMVITDLKNNWISPLDISGHGHREVIIKLCTIILELDARVQALERVDEKFNVLTSKGLADDHP